MMNFKKKQNLKLRARGFTFVEIIVAVFIFSLVMVAVTRTFSSSIGGYKMARIVQKNLEDVQFIMNRTAKTLRTSSVTNFSSADSITIYDYSSGNCYKYRFTLGNKIEVSSAAEDISDKEIEDFCDAVNLSVFIPLADSFVQGRFLAIPSDKNSGDEKLGKITISMAVCANSSCTEDKVNMQTSVSLRDYYNAGI